MPVHRIRIEHQSNTVVLSAGGELDAYTAPALEQALSDAEIGIHGRFLADLSRVTFLDSTALGLLVRTVRDVTKRGGRARVVLPQTTARRIFEITTLDRVLPIAGSRAEALKELVAIEDAPEAESV
ncbi:MAG: STAS domain-containing protein [Actinobacteria bacterium]|nr:STAS domain-containing protein [Actinomycetota bacterium]